MPGAQQRRGLRRARCRRGCAARSPRRRRCACCSRRRSASPSCSPMRVVGADVALEAVLLLAGLAVLALAAGVDHAADADAVADLVLGDLGADLLDDAGDLVARAPAGRCASPHSSRPVWMSEWQIPAKAILIRTSVGPRSRRSMVVFSNGAFGRGGVGGDVAHQGHAPRASDRIGVPSVIPRPAQARDGWLTAAADCARPATKARTQCSTSSLGVGRRQLHPDAGLALRHHRVGEGDHVDALLRASRRRSGRPARRRRTSPG